jgi:hypothetical protein
MTLTDEQARMMDAIAVLLQGALPHRIVTIAAYDSEDEKREVEAAVLYERYGLSVYIESDFQPVRRDTLAVYQRLAKLQTKEQFEAMRREEAIALGDGPWSMTDEEYETHQAWAQGKPSGAADFADASISGTTPLGAKIDAPADQKAPMADRYSCSTDEAVGRVLNDDRPDSMVTGEALLRGYSALGDVAADLAEVAKAHACSVYVSLTVDGKKVDIEARAE